MGREKWGGRRGECWREIDFITHKYSVGGKASKTKISPG